MLLTSYLPPLLFFSSFVPLFAHAFPSTTHHTSTNATSLRTIYQFPNETWVENLAIRSNGKILVTLITSPEVWQIDPDAQTAELIATFPNATSALGITEVSHDVFAVAVGNLSDVTFQPINGSWSIWTIELRDHHSGGYNHGHDQHHGADVRKITDIPEAGFLNGMTTLPSTPTTILVADSVRGLIYSVDTLIGAHCTAIDSPAFKPNMLAPAILGVNGIHIRDSYLYFTNSFAPPLLGRISISANGTATGPFETLVEHATFPTNLGAQADDFTFDGAGNAWITTDASNMLIKWTASTGKVTVEVGGTEDPDVAGCTAATFDKREKGLLYVTTNGGIPFPPVGGVVGGKIVAVDTVGL